MAAKPPVNRPPFNRLKAYRPTAIINSPPGERKHILRRFWFPAVLMLALAAGGLTGIIAAYQGGQHRGAIGLSVKHMKVSAAGTAWAKALQ